MDFSRYRKQAVLNVTLGEEQSMEWFRGMSLMTSSSGACNAPQDQPTALSTEPDPTKDHRL